MNIHTYANISVNIKLCEYKYVTQLVRFKVRGGSNYTTNIITFK